MSYNYNKNRKDNKVRCNFPSCQHKTRYLDPKEALRDSNGNYYHKDCYKSQEDIKQIIALFKKSINKNVVVSQLQDVINTIAFKKGLGTDVILFGLRYYIKNEIPLHYPKGLYYVIQNKDMMQAYHEAKDRNAIKGHKIEIKDATHTTFTHKPIKQKRFSDILK